MAESVSVVLGVLVKQCKVPAMDAMKVIPALMAAGVRDEESLRNLSERKLAECVKDAKLRRKVTVTMRGKSSASASKVSKKSGHQRDEAAVVVSGKAGEIIPGPTRKYLDDEVLVTYEIVVNRSPVMVLWAAVVANVRGYDWASSLSLAQAAADWYAQRKGEHWGILEPVNDAGAEQGRPKICEVELVGVKVRAVPQADVSNSFRALDARGKLISATRPAGYLTRSFGTNLSVLTGALYKLAEAMPKEELEAGSSTYRAYEEFRPDVARGAAGWGSQSCIKVEKIVHLIGVYKQISAAKSAKESKCTQKIEGEPTVVKSGSKNEPQEIENEALEEQDKTT
mmetsp:Transcript_13155/g.40479  ORF Transcript_13155/g.40479 Transcript_13155/m.40479 type:complete len:340 (-) Transcript_13155:952-1971(-)|eukprot:CAMPEP_0198732274 /NCGR_PEP_ID=MMETSP1475-20131203/34763_1 /TAXON_ID= ORGANISM="Unidentified sp., Strain CCMP1999" /NCGR_SAMPLE_ID=MMETSP1475 /ASSEMBLY_ACC=CAM_ASM_001111 /LENGTH=339 /DNA_ID=CAMNT_0044495343 /DNA_START=163 /DNA_END=1182 /DNA_ORIENTATION=-